MYGTNLISMAALIGMAVVFLFVFSGCRSIQTGYISKVNNEFIKQALAPEEILAKHI